MIIGLGEFLDTEVGYAVWFAVEVVLWGSVLAAIVWRRRRD